MGVSIVAQQKKIRLASMRMRVRSLASLSGLRIQPCRELWCNGILLVQYRYFSHTEYENIIFI